VKMPEVSNLSSSTTIEEEEEQEEEDQQEEERGGDSEEKSPASTISKYDSDSSSSAGVTRSSPLSATLYEEIHATPTPVSATPEQSLDLTTAIATALTGPVTAYYTPAPKLLHEPLTKKFQESKVMENKHKRQLEQWVGKHRFPTLLYSGRRDGFSASTFHSKCDGKGSTIVIVQSKEGYLFGGYAAPSWGGRAGAKNKPGCFLFTLSNPHGIQSTQYISTNNDYNIYSHPSFGPVFGGTVHGFDLCVFSGSNENTTSYTAFPGDYHDTTDKGNYTFAGTNNFQISEIEIYSFA
jgi:hypothetical protein